MLASLPHSVRASLPFRVSFGGACPDSVAIQIEAPVLGGTATEEIFSPTVPVASDAGISLFRSGSLLLGYAQAPFVANELAARTEAIYRRVLAVTHGRHLYRIWNYVPEINMRTGGIENYRAFCQGRSLAFEATLGGSFQPQLPAASAVGCQGRRLEVIFVAGEAPPTHFENPEQVPAYFYPLKHGPRAPSFARATVGNDGPARWTFISGTAAIKGHETVAPGALDAQIDCTLDNLRLIAQAAGQPIEPSSAGATRRHFKVYLRDAGDFKTVRTRLERELLSPADQVIYLQADICRAELKLEVEATLCSRPPPT
jgi:chorismate lyase / 3-hydroxybenzoate synthase